MPWYSICLGDSRCGRGPHRTKFLRFPGNHRKSRYVGNIQWIFTGSDKVVKLIWSKLCKLPLIAPVIVILHVVINDELYFAKGHAFSQFCLGCGLSYGQRSFPVGHCPSSSPGVTWTGAAFLSERMRMKR